MLRIFSNLVLTIVISLILQSSIRPQEAPSAGPIPVTTMIDYSPNTGDFLAGIAYGYSNNTNQFVNLPVPGGTLISIIGSMTYGSFASSGTFGGGGVYYLITVSTGLFTVNLLKGVGTFVAPLSISNLNGISYNPVNGLYYVVDATNLYTLDIVTGVCTPAVRWEFPGVYSLISQLTVQAMLTVIIL